MRALVPAGGVIMPLLEFKSPCQEARLTVPAPEHYWLLFYVLALRNTDKTIRFPIEGVEGSAHSRLTVQIG